MKKCSMQSLLAYCVMSVTLVVAPAQGSDRAPLGEEMPPRQYTFSWMFADSSSMKPRGGTTSGPEVQLDRATSEAFTGLQAPNLDDKERDRRAILAMAGDYRTSFDFIETVGFTEGYQPKAPYQSWGTERVYVVANEPEFVSLQHIIVMHFLDADGFESDAMVVKHWRQDWQYEDSAVHAFQGRGAFSRRALDDDSRAGAWTQTVYQVDDSPRYEAVGRWTHAPGVSYWQSDDRRRPLPRREFSVRDDYQALYGSHRITITPAGWTQEEDALKLVLDENNRPSALQPYLARKPVYPDTIACSIMTLAPVTTIGGTRAPSGRGCAITGPPCIKPSLSSVSSRQSMVCRCSWRFLAWQASISSLQPPWMRPSKRCWALTLPFRLPLPA